MKTRTALLTLGLVSSLAPGAAADARLLGDPTGQTYSKLQQAVDVARPGDVLIIGEGAYERFVIDAKELWVLAAPGASVQIEGTVVIKNLHANQSVVLGGLALMGSEEDDQSGDALFVRDCMGAVRIQDCSVEGGDGLASPLYYNLMGDGGNGATLLSSPRVAFSGCTIVGGEAAGECCDAYACTGGEGGFGVDAVDSSVTFYQCSIEGGEGGDCGSAGGDAGAGARIQNVGVVAVATSFEGGQAGDAWDFLPCCAGDGGHGLHLLGNAQARFLECTFQGGALGWSCCGADPGTVGMDTLPAGLSQEPGTARRFSASTIGVAEERLDVTVVGQPGDQAFLLSSLEYGSVYQPTLTGMLLVSPSTPLPGTPLGVIPASGILQAQFALSGANRAQPGLFLQGLILPSSGPSVLANPLHVALVTRVAQPNCNGNASNDLLDVFDGTSADCDNNLVPDVCDLDCNANGIPDTCDLSNGSSVDCDGNAIPDECEVLVDCNANSVPDICDIIVGTSLDQNHSGVPDECEVAGATFWVDASAAVGGDGSVGAPFTNLKDAIHVTLPADTIMVKDGVYTGHKNRELSFFGKDLYVRSENGPMACILDCQNSGRAFHLRDAETLATVIEGFTIINGFANDPNGGGQFKGGGIFTFLSDVTVRGCVIMNCVSDRDGGGIYATGDLVVSGCTFIGNTAFVDLGGFTLGRGAGIFCSGNLEVSRSDFTDNNAWRGGGIFVVGTAKNAFVSHCRFLGNTADGNGGAIGCELVIPVGGTPQGLAVDNSLLVGNTASNGAGVWAGNQFGSSRLWITSSTVAFNTASGGAGTGGVRVAHQTDAFFSNSILWGNAGVVPEVRVDTGAELDVDFCDVAGGQAGVMALGALNWNAGNLNTDPLFVDSVGGDYRLRASSPCENAGSNALLAADTLDVDGDGDVLEAVPEDLDGAPRVTGLAVDMGAFERMP